MKASSAIGIAVACLGIALGATMEGSPVMALLNMPAMLIVLGGTFGATMAGTSFANIKAIPALYKKAFLSEPPDLNGRVTELVGYAEKARRDGLLALDEQLSTVEDPFTKQGPAARRRRHRPRARRRGARRRERRACASATSRAPSPSRRPAASPRPWASSARSSGSCTCSQNLDQPETLGPSISAAFIATLLGVGVGQRRLPPGRQPPQAAVGRGAALPLHDARGHPRDPGGRQPAHGEREAHHLRPAERASRRGRRRRGRPARRPGRPPSHGRPTAGAAGRTTTKESTRTRSAGSSRTRT